MATVTRENIGTLHDKLTVKLAKEDYLPSFDKALKQYAKNANVPGFRKGMVPAGMVRKMYGQGLFQEEVLRSAGRELDTYINTEKVGILGQAMLMRSDKPVALDINAPGDAEFSFEVGLKPELSIPALEGSTPLTFYKVAVSDKVVDDEVLRTSRRYGTEEERSEVATKDDVIYATVEPCDADGNPIEGAEKKEAAALLETLPAKLQETLMGMQVGTAFTVRPSDVAVEEELPGFLGNFMKVDAAAADFLFQVTLTKVGMIIPAELNIMFFAQVFPDAEIKDEAGFRERLRTEIQREYDRMATTRLNDEIFELLVHNTPITLPVAFLKRFMREGGEKFIPDAQVEKEFPAYDHQLRWNLISEKIMADNNVSVSLEEIKENIKAQILGYFGMVNADEAPWLDGYVDKQLKEDKVLNETYRRLLMDKLFAFLRTRFNVTEQPIAEEEFYKLPSPHAVHHHH